MKNIAIVLVWVGLACTVLGQSFLTNGLAAYYPFKGDAHDESGRGNDGLTQGAKLLSDRFGTADRGYYFDGVESKILVPESIFGPDVDGCTVSAWITTDKGPYTNWCYSIYTKSGLNGAVTMQIEWGRFEFSPKLKSATNWLWASTPMISNAVTHVVGVYEKGKRSCLYTNGVLASSTPIPDDTLFLDSVYPLVSSLGMYEFVPRPYAGFRGILEDVRIYSRALSATEVKQLYALEAKAGVASFKAREMPVPILESANTARPNSSGTGFFITDDGYLITVAHVVRNREHMRVVAAEGEVNAKLVIADAANDVALLKAEGKFSALPIAPSRSMALGSTVATVGFPNIGVQGVAPKLAKGEIAALTGAMDDPRFFQISVPVQPGNSGGALVDERGNVVGVVAGKLVARARFVADGPAPENVAYALKSSFILGLLESVPEAVDKLKEPHTQVQKLEDVAKSARKAAVLVLVY